MTSDVSSDGISSASITAPHPDFLAPSFSLLSSDGETYALSDFRGQVILINFWASWCPPCRAEMPAMQKVFEEYNEQGFTILAINSTVQDTQTNANDFIQTNNLTFPVLFDLEGNATTAYQIRALPTSFFIDREGIIREVVVGGPLPEASLRERIFRLLDKE